MGSRSDQLFHRRKRKKVRDYERAKKLLPERSRVLIVCEGEKTEPLYFKFLRNKLGLTATVEVSGESDSAPSKVVKFGKKKIKLDLDYEYVFFVFDKDSHADYDTALSWIRDMKSQRNYKNISISAITSNPCFELWFLLHLRQFATPCAAGGGNSACENLRSVLRQQPGFEDYKKGEQKHFKLLYEKLHVAKKRSAQLLAQCQSAGEYKHHGNPSTYVHELVGLLENLAKGQQRH